jgi:hypothetical protein
MNRLEEIYRKYTAPTEKVLEVYKGDEEMMRN